MQQEQIFCSEEFSDNARETSFLSFRPVSSNVYYKKKLCVWLKCSNLFSPLLQLIQCNHCSEMFLSTT